jgi:hypothetical protein
MATCYHSLLRKTPWDGKKSLMTSLSQIIHKLKHRIGEYLPKIRQLINAKADI